MHNYYYSYHWRCNVCTLIFAMYYDTEQPRSTAGYGQGIPQLIVFGRNPADLPNGVRKNKQHHLCGLIFLDFNDSS